MWHSFLAFHIRHLERHNVGGKLNFDLELHFTSIPHEFMECLLKRHYNSFNSIQQ